MKRGSIAVLSCVLFFISVAGLLYAQNTPPQKPKSKPLAEQKQSVLKVFADSPCVFYIDAEKRGIAEPGKPLKVPVGLGEHLLKADCENSGIWESDYKIESVGQKVVRIRFIRYKGGFVLDAKTGLMWASKDNGDGINWDDARAYCEKYSGGGNSDWRMPTLDELESIYEAESAGIETHIKRTSCCHWASDSRGSEAATFHFYTGSRRWYAKFYSSYNHALPVRGGK